jgi:antitoxin component of MazEF toxin-antitoxin module
MSKLKTLTRSGNSVAVVLDRELLEAAGLEAGATVEIDVTDGIISIGRPRDKKRAAKVDRVLGKLDRRYGAVFKKLAE